MFILLVSCSSDSTDDSGTGPEDEHQVPEVSFPSITLHQKVIDAANNGNIGAIQAQLAMEMAQTAAEYYDVVLPPEAAHLLKLNKTDLENWTYSWQIDELTVTLQFEDWGNIWFLNQYYDGTDGMGITYNHWLRGYFATATDEFMGTLQIYDFGSSEPIIFFKWEMDPLLDEFMEANIMNLFKVKIDLVNYENGTTIILDDTINHWLIDINSDGTGSWTQYENGTDEVLGEGQWN